MKTKLKITKKQEKKEMPKSKVLVPALHESHKIRKHTDFMRREIYN